MNLALAIVFLWLGAALLTVAFHPLGDLGDNAVYGPQSIFQTLQGKITEKPNASAFETAETTTQ